MSKKKYVVESAFENVSVQKIMQLGLDVNGRIINWTDSIEDVEELNSDYINEHYGELQDEAYQKGFKDGREVGIKDGMCEAWEAAKKIVVDPDHGGIASGTLLEIFGMRGYSYIMQENTAQQAIDKIKAYEDNDRIEVGDEVKQITASGMETGDYCVITRISGDSMSGFSPDGHVVICGSQVEKWWTKTGKHYDIQSILEAMRE